MTLWRAMLATGGSSPLTRGKPTERLLRWSPDGLIPAHAGKTSPAHRALSAMRAHPRSRGENAVADHADCIIVGSSPLTRGKLLVAVVREAFRGLIPAHAGKTRVAIYNVTTMGAHPRSRGENQGVGGQLSEVQGSSPLTRGKRQVGGERVLGSGLIPAHAGKTLGVSLRAAERRAHPRSRGENSLSGLE